jgi:hypothetical protein
MSSTPSRPMSMRRPDPGKKEKEKDPLALLEDESIPIVREGFLQKKPGGERNEAKKFKTRWCILKRNILFYFKSVDDTAPKGWIDLTEVSLRLHSKQDPVGIDVYALDTPKKTYLLFSDRSNDDMRDWVSDLKVAMANQQIEPVAVDGILTLSSLRCRDLAKETDCMLTISHRRQVVRTVVVKKTCNPDFPEPCVFEVTEIPCSVSIVVTSTKGDFLGCDRLRITSECLVSDIHASLQQRKKREPVTGTIAYSVELDSTPVPVNPDYSAAATRLILDDFLDVCSEYFESDRAISTEGIFRLSPSLTELRKFKIRVEEALPDLSSIEACDDPILVAGLLKLLLREMEPPLLPYALFEPLLSQVRPCGNNEDAIVAMWIRMICTSEKLSLPQQRMWQKLFSLLARVAACSSRNHMHASNLAVVFAPVVCRPVVETIETLVQDMPVAQMAVEVLIRRSADVFAAVEPEWSAHRNPLYHR